MERSLATMSPLGGGKKPLPPLDQQTVLADFDDWSKRYLQAAEAQKADMEEQGRILAQARRPVFKELITRDPQRALMNAVPMVVRQKLPPGVVNLLEERVADRGVLRNYWRAPDPASDEPPVIRYAETEDGRTMRAYVYGRRAQEVGWTMNASLNGVAMDGEFAVNESPLRILEIGELADPNKKAIEVCPVSGNTTEAVPSGEPVSQATPAVEAYGEIVYLCDGSHALLYEQSLLMGESSSGGAQGFTGILPSAPTPSVGVVKVLCIPAIFADQAQVPASEATLLNMLRETGDFYQVTSYGRLTLQATVTPPVVLPRNQAWYKGKDTTDGYVKEIDGLSLEMSHAKEAARKLGYDWQDYHATIVRANGGARAPTSFGGGGNVWMRGDSVSTCSHEIGHAFGLAHANFWQTNGASVIGPGGNVEYGDTYDNMGSTSPPTGHWNVQAKNQVKWLPDEFAPPITRSGTYRIHAFDTPRLEPGKSYGLRISKDLERTYWGEYRTLFTTNTWASNGLLLGWKWPNNSGGNLQLLDTTPGSPNDRSDAGITVGRTFSDREAGIHVTTLAVNSQTVPSSLDVRVNLGQFPGNRSPTLSLAPSASVVLANTPVTFTATAEDPDGDEVSYGWIWHDPLVSPNQPTATRTFASSGIYTLSCVVSDMKGGTAIRNAVITVGTGGGRFTISGRITKEGAGMRGINVSTSGTNGTLTDSDGYYTISNLAAGTYTVTPAEHGLVFNELFNNSITVGPSFKGADFTVDELPRVSLTAPNPLAVEGGATGTFRLSRTGSTALPLSVYVFAVQGTATKTTDYTFSPDYTAVTSTPWQTFTIPEDAEFLDVTVTAVNDAIQEGYEAVTLVLGQDASFAPGSFVTATVGIADDDTPRPRVSLTAGSLQVNEGGGEPLLCTVTRTGDTTASLAVAYSVLGTGTATAGTDYLSLPGTVTIPAGAESASFEITPVNDSLAEVTETVRVSIATSTLFVADAGANALTLKIVDDDTQVVTVTASDSVATEVNLSQPGAVADPGTFLLTRTGDVSGPLTVYYSVAGTALHGTDYEALSGSVEFAAAQTQTVVTIMPIRDGIGEAPETVVLSIAAGNGNYLLGATFSGTVTLNDSGDPPVVEVSNVSVPVLESGTNATFRITVKGTGTGTLTVRYSIGGTATAGQDYSITGLNTTTMEGTASVTLNNGTATGDVTVTMLNDALAESLETVVMTLLPDPSYTLWGPKSSTTLLLQDDEQPTVFVDGQVGTGGNAFIAENSTTTALKFWVSRTGATTSALTVNYSMTGTAANGVDHTMLSGSAVIPAGAPGVDVTFNTIDDTTFEGTETVTLHLESGSYARGPDATLYITDNDSGGPAVAFASTGGSGVESTTDVSIPVRLTAASASPVTVEYSLEAGARTTTALSGLWVRVVKTGTSFESYLSRDGSTFVKTSSTRTVSGFPTSYLAGVALSGVTVPGAFEIDQLSVTGLSAGGSAGARVATDLAGSTSPGGMTESGGFYRVAAGGPDYVIAGATDGGYLIYFPITNSANCTVTARVLNMTCTNSSVKAGAMIRESTATNARHFTYIVDSNAATRQVYRTTAGGNSTSAFVATNLPRPQWLRLQRAGNVFSVFSSADGVTFSPYGSSQTLPLSSSLLVGLTASARSDGLLTQATFDNVSISPIPAQPLQGRTVGYVNEPGQVTENSGTYTITASGFGIMSSMSSNEDEGHFLSTQVSGDFTLTARLNDIQGGAVNAQAGLMVRESVSYRSRAVYFGLIAGTSPVVPEYRARLSATTSGEGMGIDYTLNPGVLTFSPGQTEKFIPLTITNDSLAESQETVNVLLNYPSRAVLGSPSSYTYTILDDDGPAISQPVAGFASVTSTGVENQSPMLVPVVISRASSNEVTVNYTTTAGGSATSGSDYTEVSGTLTFSPGETVKNISLPILNDAIAESGKTIVLSLSSPSNAQLSTASIHTFTLTDDDVPVVTLAATVPTATEGGGSGAFTFYRTGPTTSALAVSFTRAGSATSGADFTAFSPTTSVTIPAGQSLVNLSVLPVQNLTPEVDETVIVTLASGGGYVIGSPAAATVTIKDDDVNTITLIASDGEASEAGNNPGELVLTRTGPLTSSLTVTLAITGTATSGSDYTGITSPVIFPLNQSTLIIPVTITQDELTEGNEEIVVAVASAASYIVGTPSTANITLVDDDLPPSVFVSSPASKATIIAQGNGLMLEATAADDGLPSPLTYTWSQLFGPGTATFENPAAASSGVTFSAPGVYGLRITVNDGQFSATDDLFVESGGFAYANWVSQDQGPPAVRGVGGESADSSFTLIGSGTGYSTTNDSGHMLFRQLPDSGGYTSMMVRLSSLSGPGTALAGITLRDTSWKGAKRVNLVVDRNGTVQFRTRTTANTADTAATLAGFAPPLWLWLQRSGGSIFASVASEDASGSPTGWIPVGNTSALTLGSNVIAGMVVSSGANTTATSTARFDQIGLAPNVPGAALHSEDIGNYTTPGSSSVSGDITTVNAVGTYDGTGGHFRYQQVWGDCMITARLLTQTGVARGSQAGVSIRDTTDNGAFGFYGRTTIDGFQAHWRSVTAGTQGTLQTGGSIGNWVRVVRKGNSLSAFRAADASGAPGAWAQVTGNLPASLTGPLLVGLVVDSNGSGTGTGTFSGLTIEPLNTAPVVDTGAASGAPVIALNATVSDDGKPNPPGACTVAWSLVNGPGPVTFENPLVEDTVAVLSVGGNHRLRLTANDGDARTFDDLVFTAPLFSPYLSWRYLNGLNGYPLAGETDDADRDGLVNLLEYALELDPLRPNGNPVIHDWVEVESEHYLRITVPKNPQATDLLYEAQVTDDPGNPLSWSSEGPVIETDTPALLRVRDNVPVAAGVRRFMRVRVSPVPLP